MRNRYTEKENRRRYRLHYKARKQGAEIVVAERTCKVVYGSELNRFCKSLVNEFNYAVQFVTI